MRREKRHHGGSNQAAETAKKRRATTTRHLPSDIIFTIFSKLPMENLYRQCRLVCKDWHSVIRDPLFVDFYSSQMDQDDKTFFIFYNHPSTKLLFVDHQTMCTKLEGKSRRVSLDYFPKPFRKSEIVGSSNGLMCLCSLPHRDSYYIFNPLTKETALLPTAPGMDEFRKINKDDELASASSGFVFDATTNTFKVVRAWCYGKAHSVFEIHTIGTGKWRRIEHHFTSFGWNTNKPLLVKKKTSQLLLNDALHWEMLDRDCVPVVGAMDITTETFRSFKTPPVHNRSLSLLTGCICVFEEILSGVVIWVMDDYGVEQSWTKKHSFLSRSIHIYGFETTRTRWDGSILLHDHQHQMYRNFEKNENQVLDIRGLSPLNKRDAVVHFASLISPKTIAAGTEVKVNRPAPHINIKPRNVRPRKKVKRPQQPTRSRVGVFGRLPR